MTILLDLEIGFGQKIGRHIIRGSNALYINIISHTPYPYTPLHILPIPYISPNPPHPHTHPPYLGFISPTTSSLIFLLILELMRSSEDDGITPDGTDEEVPWGGDVLACPPPLLPGLVRGAET